MWRQYNWSEAPRRAALVRAKAQKKLELSSVCRRGDAHIRHHSLQTHKPRVIIVVRFDFDVGHMEVVRLAPV